MTAFTPDYELLDCGDGRRLERFSQLILDRPAPQATWPKSKNIASWNKAHAYYERSESGQGAWQDLSVFPADWQLQIDKVRVELRASPNNQIGIFPEQLPNWRWLHQALSLSSRPVRVLNAFAYTGIATLMASSAGQHVQVCHLDGAKASVSWAKRNSELSKLNENSIRWIVDDVIKFLQREVKRGQRYDAFILDPPAFGRGASGPPWKLERDLPILLDLVDQLLSDTPSFVILSCHAENLFSDDLKKMLNDLRAFRGCRADSVDLVIPSKHGHSLPSSTCGRIASKELQANLEKN